jgi:hypothetical protein
MPIRFAKGPAADGSIGFNRNKTFINESDDSIFTSAPSQLPLVRQIGQDKWLYGLSHLHSNSYINQITVASDYSGWKYILARTTNKKTFLQQTFYTNNLMSSSIMIIN